MHESGTSRTRSRRAPIGIVFGSLTPPETMARTAGLAETLGFGELWFSEDCYFSGGMSGAAHILASTEEIPVGLGVVSAVTRHPAVAAMEFAGMARTHPGRVRPGVGLGVRAWLRQMGLMPASPISALREGVLALRGLLDGEEVTLEGETHRLDGVRLDFPPQERLPLYVGAVNGRSLRLSGEVADGTVLSVLSGSAYVGWARERIREGLEAARGGGDHRVATFALYSVDHDSGRAKEAVREAVAFFLAAEIESALARVAGVAEEATALLAEGGTAHLAREMPDEWINELAVAGNPEECARGLRGLLDAGSDSVNLWLFPTERAEEVARLTAHEVFPRLGLETPSPQYGRKRTAPDG